MIDSSISPRDARDGVNPILADLRTLRGEVKLQLHLGTMEAQDRWKELEARYHSLEHAAELRGAKVVEGLVDRAGALLDELKALRSQLS